MIENIKIVVPTLNTYSILPKLVNSLENQTWNKWNLLFVDGNSNKTHYKWLKNASKKDSRLKTLLLPFRDGLTISHVL